MSPGQGVNHSWLGQLSRGMVLKADVCLCSELATKRPLWFSGAELRSSTEEQSAWLGAPLGFLHDFWSSQVSSALLVRSHVAVLCPMGFFTSI